MKRLLLVVGFPVVLGLLWWSGQHRVPSATADVAIESAKVVELRGVVISRLTTVGATKTAENTSYTEDGVSDLTFRLPPARLEEALAELNQVGGTVTRQQVQLDELDDEANGFSSSLAGVGGCLGQVADRIEAGSLERATTDVASCREQVADLATRLDTSPQAAEDAVLNVHISPKDTTSLALMIGVALLAAALAVMAFVTLRSARADHVYDITERAPSSVLEDLYDRRN